MCGRYVRTSDKQRIVEHFQIGGDVFDLCPPSYNIAPTSLQPVIRINPETGLRNLVQMRWGLIPSWAKEPRLLGISTINAQAETLTEKPIWRRPFKKRRCLIPADAFYEWLQLDEKTKQPYAFGMRDELPFAFAGLWERWHHPNGVPLDTFTIITTAPNPLTARVHNRMPLILRTEDYDRWLSHFWLTGEDSQPLPLDLLRPYDAEAMKAWKVSTDVGNVRNNHAALAVEVQ